MPHTIGAPTISGGPPPDGTIGVPYWYQFTVSFGMGNGGTCPHLGTLPPGLFFSNVYVEQDHTITNQDTGLLTPYTSTVAWGGYLGVLYGIPTVAGLYSNIIFEASNSNGTGMSNQYSITIGSPSPPTISGGPPPNGVVGESYWYQFTVGLGQGTNSVAHAGMLPPGLYFDNITVDQLGRIKNHNGSVTTYTTTMPYGSYLGTIYGTPTTTGTYNWLQFQALAYFNGNNTVAEVGQFSITITTPIPPSIHGTPTTSDFVGIPYSFIPTLYKIGGVSCNVAQLPPGLNFTNNSITGMPTIAGVYSGIILTGYGLDFVTLVGTIGPFSITVYNMPSIDGNPDTIAYKGVYYSFIPTSDGVLSFIVSGLIPSGIIFNSTDGSLTGIPTTIGMYGPISIHGINGQYTAILASFYIEVKQASFPRLYNFAVEALVISFPLSTISSLPSGSYQSGIKIELRSNIQDAVIYFSIDGTYPSIEYTSPIILQSSIELKTIAIYNNITSDIFTEEYSVLNYQVPGIEYSTYLSTHRPIVNKFASQLCINKPIELVGSSVQYAISNSGIEQKLIGGTYNEFSNYIIDNNLPSLFADEQMQYPFPFVFSLTINPNDYFTIPDEYACTYLNGVNTSGIVNNLTCRFSSNYSNNSTVTVVSDYALRLCIDVLNSTKDSVIIPVWTNITIGSYLVSTSSNVLFSNDNVKYTSILKTIGSKFYMKGILPATSIYGDNILDISIYLAYDEVVNESSF